MTGSKQKAFLSPDEEQSRGHLSLFLTTGTSKNKALASNESKCYLTRPHVLAARVSIETNDLVEQAAYLLCFAGKNTLKNIIEEEYFLGNIFAGKNTLKKNIF